MGTVFTLDVRGPGVDRAVLDDVIAFSHHVDAVMSTYRRDSEVSRIGRGELAAGDASAEVRAVLERCAELEDETDGYFSARPAGRLDPSGYVKGWAIAELSRRLVAAGSGAHCVNGGGDVQCVGESSPGTPWSVGIAHPLRPTQLVDVVTGSGPLAVATSGTAERGAHIVDPRSRERPLGLASVSIIGTDIALADAYATAAVAMGTRAQQWISERGLTAVLVHADGQIERVTPAAA